MLSGKVLKFLSYWGFSYHLCCASITRCSRSINYSKISGGTCQSLGGGWERSGDMLVCEIKEQ